MRLFNQSHLRSLALFTSSLFLAACASGPTKPSVDFNQDYNFSTVKKVAFYSGSGKVSGDNDMQLSDIQKGRINRALAFALGQKGIQVIEQTADADMLLSWHLVTQFKTDVKSFDNPAMYGPYYGYNRYSMYSCWSCMGGSEIVTTNYTDGYFILDMIDPSLQKSVWRSTIHSRLTGNEELKDQVKIDAAAVNLLGSFPPGSAPAN